MDIQYRSHRNGVMETGDYNAIRNNQGVTNGFDQQRFVPFIYADITEHLKFASELEIEHGIRGAGEIEISLELAHLDYLISEPFNIRAGILLVPIGKFNLLHDSPLNDMTDRPLVSQFIIPTTMSEIGAGFYGTFYPGQTSKLDYELYVTTGPCGSDPDGTPRINEETGTKNSRQRKCESTADGLDINNGKAVSGRTDETSLILNRMLNQEMTRLQKVMEGAGTVESAEAVAERSGAIVTLIDRARTWDFDFCKGDAQNIMHEMLDRHFKELEMSWWGWAPKVEGPFPSALIRLAEKLDFNVERFSKVSTSR